MMMTLLAAVSHDPIPIATIHAAVIAIFLGGLVAYAVVVAQHIAEMTEAALAPARLANEIEASGAFWMGSDVGDLVEGFDPHDRAAREGLLRKLSEIADSFTPASSDVEQEQAHTTAIRCAMIMHLLTASPPFRARVARVGQRLEVDSAPALLALNSAAEAEAWSLAMRHFANDVDYMLTGKRHALRELMGTKSPFQVAPDPAKSRPSVVSDYEDRMGAGDPARTYRRFFKNVRRGNALAIDTHRALVALESYQRARESRRSLGAAAVAGGVTLIVLVAGVLLPIVHQSTPRWLYTWLPAAIYYCAALLGLRFLVGRYVEADDAHRRRT